MQACIFGNVEAIQELLRAGAKPTYKDLVSCSQAIT
jgi:hypothetical protein